MVVHRCSSSSIGAVRMALWVARAKGESSTVDVHPKNSFLKIFGKIIPEAK